MPLQPSEPVSDTRQIDNVEAMEFARRHPIVDSIAGRVCHLTTARNIGHILEDGFIRVETSRDGLFPRREGAALSACMRLGAVSVFDLGAPWDQLCRLHCIGEDVFSYNLDWWHFFNLGTESVAILLDDSVRASFASEPGTSGQFIRGAEYCHIGDVESSKFVGFVLRTGDIFEPESYKIRSYDLDQTDGLLRDLEQWGSWLDLVKRAAGLTPEQEIGLDDMTLLKLERLFRPHLGGPAA